jgi:hypothetical protein
MLLVRIGKETEGSSDYVPPPSVFVPKEIAMSTGLTPMLAAIFVVGGVFRIINAWVKRFPSWGWVRANGVLTVLLGIAIWQAVLRDGLVGYRPPPTRSRCSQSPSACGRG